MIGRNRNLVDRIRLLKKKDIDKWSEEGEQIDSMLFRTTSRWWRRKRIDLFAFFLRLKGRRRRKTCQLVAQLSCRSIHNQEKRKNGNEWLRNGKEWEWRGRGRERNTWTWGVAFLNGTYQFLSLSPSFVIDSFRLRDVSDEKLTAKIFIWLTPRGRRFVSISS